MTIQNNFLDLKSGVIEVSVHRMTQWMV